MLLEIDSNIAIITLLSAGLVMLVVRAVQDYRTGVRLQKMEKHMAWLVGVLRVEHEASPYQRM